MTRDAERDHAPYLSVVDHEHHVALAWTNGRVKLEVMVPLNDTAKHGAVFRVLDVPPLPSFSTDVDLYLAGTMLCYVPIPEPYDQGGDLVGTSRVTNGGSGEDADVQRLRLFTCRNIITVERYAGITARPKPADPNPPLRTPASEPVHVEGDA